MATHSSILAWRTSGKGESGGLWGCRESDMTGAAWHILELFFSRVSAALFAPLRLLLECHFLRRFFLGHPDKQHPLSFSPSCSYVLMCGGFIHSVFFCLKLSFKILCLSSHHIRVHMRAHTRSGGHLLNELKRSGFQSVSTLWVTRQ